MPWWPSRDPCSKLRIRLAMNIYSHVDFLQHIAARAHCPARDTVQFDLYPSRSTPRKMATPIKPWEIRNSASNGSLSRRDDQGTPHGAGGGPSPPPAVPPRPANTAG